MIIKRFSDTMLLSNKEDVLRIHLYCKLLEKGIRPFEKDMSLIIDLYLLGGYNDKEEQSQFISHCITMKYRKAEQSVRNLFSKYVTLGVFRRDKQNSLYVTSDFLPKEECDKIVINHLISHAK